MAETLTTKASESAKVDKYMGELKHAKKSVLEVLRRVILSADPEIGEEIKWNAPTFFYSGPMPPFDPKEYRRYLVVSNLFQKDAIRLVFWGGGKVDDQSGLLTGDYKDGRRLASFTSLDEVAAKTEVLQHIVREQLRLIEKYSLNL